MDIRKILQYKTLFDVIARQVTDDDGNAVEVWYARDLQQRLGYARWENFVIAIGRAMEACKTLGINIDDHFRGVTKMIELPNKNHSNSPYNSRYYVVSSIRLCR